MMATGNSSGNRLAGAVSPYLLSHAHQEVDWYPWGQEAFDEAARRDVPLLISIGYRTCHWCHVMSRECFDDSDIASLINDTVVAVKVDREEHGDVDATYLMQAGAFTKNLGWPLTVFATPAGKAFYAATYLPPEPRDSLPSLPDVLHAVSTAWRDNREDVLTQSRSLVEALAAAQEAMVENPSSVPDGLALDQATQTALEQQDPVHGGFGQAPKFPMAPLVNYLLARGDSGDADAKQCAQRVLQTYAQSGLFDPVEGGFFRYATEADFTTPHYERMLTDNAGLLLAYSRLGDTEMAGRILTFLTNQLGLAGGFASGQDSESIIDGQSSEGGYYLLDATQRALLEPPALDDKVVTGWNGLLLEALSAAHRAGVPGEPGPVAKALAQWLIEQHVVKGKLVRVSRNGVTSDAPATLEDYGGLALGLLEVGCALGWAEGVAHARDIINAALEAHGALGDPLLVSHGLSRPGHAPGDLSEGASPSGPSLMALALLRWSHLSSHPELRERAVSLIAPYAQQAIAQPLGFAGVLRFLAEYRAPARELIVVGEDFSPEWATARSWTPPGAISLILTPAQAGEFLALGISLLEGRTQAQQTTAYLCESGVCALPVSDPAVLAAKLTQ